MIFWGEPGATRAREVAQDLIDAPTITLCQQNRPLSCPGCLHPARPITLFYMALRIGPMTSLTRDVCPDAFADGLRRGVWAVQPSGVGCWSLDIHLNAPVSWAYHKMW